MNVPNLMQALGEVSLFAKLTMVVAIAAFGLAVSYVFRPTALKLTLMRPVSLAAIFATICVLLAGWFAVFAETAATPDGHLPLSAFGQGIAETLTTGFVCFGFLAAAWLLVAMGMLRRGTVDA
jgi:hypothetical protein